MYLRMKKNAYFFHAQFYGVYMWWRLRTKLLKITQYFKKPNVEKKIASLFLNTWNISIKSLFKLIATEKLISLSQTFFSSIDT